ncbi:protein MTSS 2 [Protobothrops mucrosquamatus]|uniref:protein MTSS 2 n=1 Tax=Protobothrops mucrosquamatus TaxID=103944 RepID=UPI0010FAF045|nr:protein MTSS 2 [Protobothrops mucrosquamatus]
MEAAEKECGALGGLFQAIVNDMKSSYPVWEDFNSKATKLHSQLRTTILAAVAFLEAFQRVADMATNTRGATRDIGSALTRMCMRHRSIETKLRHFTNALMESLINPLQERIEDWKKTANQLDKDHAKEYKRARHEIKKKSSDTLKLQKKARKELLGKGDLQPQLDNALQDVNDLYLLLEETEKQAVRKALVEERGRFCTFIAYLQPVVNGEITMLGEITHLQGIIDDLVVLTADPHKLPTASEQVIKDLKGSDYSWSYQTPPSSPGSSGSRKSSLCRYVWGYNASMSRASGHVPSISPGFTFYSHSVAQPVNANTRLSSVSSHDSGFISQDAVFSKPPSPMPLDITSQKSSSSASSEASETCQSVSECNSPTSDWSKLPLYEQPGANLLPRRKDRVELLREAEPGLPPLIYPGLSLEDGPRPRLSPASIAAKHGEEVSPAASELAMVLTHGLSLEHQKSSRDSLQFSSGYSTQTTTPSCSEDAIPSQGSEYDCYSVNGDMEGDNQNELDKSSTIPRNSNIAQNYRRMIQTKRPASTAGLPTGTALPTGTTPGVATIRRTPSTKPTVRRTVSSAGPIPIRPPIVPVKTPTVPDSPSHAGPLRMGSEECVFYADDACSVHSLTKVSPKRLSLPNASWGSNTLEISVYTGAGKPSTEEEQQLAANRHSLVEKIGELVASAHALGDGQFPFPTVCSDPGPEEQTPNLPLAASSEPPTEDMLVAIRRGVRLRRTITNDRSAPRFL